MGLEGNAAEILNKANAGYTFEPDNPKALKEQIIKMISLSHNDILQMGKNAKMYYSENLSITSSVDKLERNFKKIAKK